MRSFGPEFPHIGFRAVNMSEGEETSPLGAPASELPDGENTASNATTVTTHPIQSEFPAVYISQIASIKIMPSPTYQGQNRVPM